MEWSKLLSDSRLGRSDEEKKDVRSEYQRDYDRIVYSSAFRRLQDKMQVSSLAESDYVRTRLTHSIEVSCVGKITCSDVDQRFFKPQSISCKVLPEVSSLYSHPVLIVYDIH